MSATDVNTGGPIWRNGSVTGAVLGALWTFTVAVAVAVVMAFATGDLFRPLILPSLGWGALVGFAAVWNRQWLWPAALALVVLGWVGFGPLLAESSLGSNLFGQLAVAIGTGLGLRKMCAPLPKGDATKHEWEEAIIAFLTGFGYVFFTAMIAIPFYVMVMTSLKSQQALLQNPLDFSLDWEKGWGLLRSYQELFRDYGFGSYLWTSFYVSVFTVILTLLFSVPGAYAVARLKFRGRAAFSRSILLIYMVPMIVLALPIYIAFSVTGLRNSIPGLLMIYPVTTIPVALYMLQGYFRGLPAEVEEAGLMDGLSRLQVIWKITLPLSLPALASVSLYVFMIAWNEFLLAFMLLDDPGIFTLTRGVSALNSSEVPRQHLMAGAVIATLPIMVIFLGLEKFMTKGLTAGSVKG
ncbi:carbohydrate ABC transporter permease [Jannaschia sp. M317]|uniref:carbohydrate ABC transporter permease n=1 Tax=Jannaschia sp. M317 TaxID=2867011 RepID=UPI0021A26A28|nr:carbohydrate ABC transporter permease [Jannaschia sp. M317]UWQ17489.1 carbohydrate ABC transporter permease [Jannaschia sp. M317]